MMKWIRVVLIVLLVLSVQPVSAKQTDVFRSWIENMKQAPRGPFSRIRWFCNDGTILEPKAYACQEHGGGVQHGEWTQQVQTLRSEGYMIANVFADISANTFMTSSGYPGILKQMIIEQFLIQADDGWIFKKARYYRGALQTEDEALGGEALLLALLKEPNSIRDHFLLMREAVRTLPHYHKNAPTSQMRQLSLMLAQTDSNFESLRIKIHVQPEVSDADRVRQYAKKQGQAELADTYEQLAGLIEAVFSPKDLTKHLLALADQARLPKFSEQLRRGAQKLDKETNSLVRFDITGQLSRLLRNHFLQVDKAVTRLIILDISILLEDELFRLSADLLEHLSNVSTGQSLAWLSQTTDALYGTGLISQRQYKTLKKVFEKQMSPGQDLLELRSDLIYVSRASDWTERKLQFHFSKTIRHFQTIEPLSVRYVHDRLHSSLMLIYSHVLDHLMVDNSWQLGISHDILGKIYSSGINGLNPGLARGILRYPLPGQDLQRFSSDSILVLPTTTSDLPPVAGIVTAGRGNILSHVQLLARNLGIPNVSVGGQLLEQIKAYKDKRVILAVSPGGLVKIEEYHPGWNKVFAQKKKGKRRILKADVEKLDLKNRGFLTLNDLRAKDSGRLAGPKAANLGELKYHFPKAVTDGVVIPFAMFKTFLDQPFSPSGPSMFDWMKNQYKLIDALREKPVEQKRVITATLLRIRSWILQTDPGDKFKKDLETMLVQNLGPNGTYGVFVRSDTNVEDLPGFTGAGLNLTVPHVVGFENILAAIRRVWASPFTQRSFGWRHAFLENPEHVYASVLLMKTVPVEKSGVMVTKNLKTGQTGWLTIAVNEGVGGAVSGQTAEELWIHMDTGQVTVLSQATEPQKRVVRETGGMEKIDASGTDEVLNSNDIKLLVDFAKQLPDRFPVLKDDQGRAVPADVEFGFLNDKLVLFQIRPLLDDFRSQNDQYLNHMDENLKNKDKKMVDLERIPGQDNL